MKLSECERWRESYGTTSRETGNPPLKNVNVGNLFPRFQIYCTSAILFGIIFRGNLEETDVNRTHKGGIRLGIRR